MDACIGQVALTILPLCIALGWILRKHERLPGTCHKFDLATYVCPAEKNKKPIQFKGKLDPDAIYSTMQRGVLLSSATKGS